jgi:hypothetical protein
MPLSDRACKIQTAPLSMGKLRGIAQPVLESCVRDSLDFGVYSSTTPARMRSMRCSASSTA